jgi:1-phosphofructokinase
VIYTVTLNPSIDYIVHVEHLMLDTVNRMTSDFKFPGGKGINVSRVLNRTGYTSTALGFLGGFTGKFVSDWLIDEGISSEFTKIEDDTRINIKLKSDSETEINGAGPKITPVEQARLEEKLSEVGKGDIVVFSGSVPSSIGEGYYGKLIQLIKEKGAEFVIDTTGADLLAATKAEPLLIKPNNHELEELFQVPLKTKAELLQYGEKLLQMKVKNVIISMAGEGALLINATGNYFAQPIKGSVKNSVGAGDSMIAGFIGNFSETQDEVESFKWGVACGTATAFSDDLATTEEIHEMFKKVVVEKI